YWVPVFSLVFIYFSRLRKDKERQSQVNKAVLKNLNRFKSLDKLVDFSTHSTSNHSSSSSNSRNDLSSNHLGLLLIVLWNCVVSSSQVCCGMNKVNVV